MSDITRVLKWHQGAVLSDECVLELGLCNQAEIKSKLFIVISHDCDLAADAVKEPYVEIVSAIFIDKLGADSHCKNARRLDIELESNKSSSPVFLKLLAISKQFIDKLIVFKFSPCNDIKFNGRELFTLRSWLASRYQRAAFPESFEAHLRAAPRVTKRTFLSQIESILEKGGKHIRGVFFDLDDGEDVERETVDDCYSLSIIVLYDSSKNEPVASEAAEVAAKALEQLFTTAFYLREQNKWQCIELRFSDAISDAVLTVAQRAQLREWRLEHMSLKEAP